VPDSNHVAWSGFCRSLAALGERRLVLLEGDRSRALDWLAGLEASLQPEAVLWVGSREQSPLATAQVAEPRKATRWLGRELDWVIWDGRAGNPPDGLAALAGTLKAGGLFFWLMPPLEQWSGFEDPDYARTGLETAGTHPFAARMAEILEAHPGVIRLHSDSMSLPPSLPEVATPFRVGATADQQALIERLVRLGQGHRKRPLVIIADRGRGKSAALGIAAVRLLRAGRQRVLVTAPSAGAVTSVFRHAWREAYGTEPAEPANRLVLEDGAELVFLDIRDLLAQQPAAELVMVDEAAALPAPLLKQVLLGWPRVAFASTVHGYEGSGRGFDIRFRAVLDAETPKWQATTLEQPIRWAADDPLEQLASRLFLLDAEAPRSSLPDGEPEVALWYPANAPEHELSEAFGLLVNAHYRTSPGDLRQWLDDPRAVSWVLRIGGRLAGVLWATREGGLDPALAQDITLGKRRLRGHLLAQSLASHSGFPEAASQQFLRIVRVAVPAELRRQGLGGRLVAAATQWAADQGLDAVGTSFGGSRSLARFWMGSGLQFVRAGLQREASSGEYPVQYIQGLSESGRVLGNRLATRLSQHWLTLVPLNWQDMEPDLLAELTASLPAPAGLSADDRRDLHSFAHGHRGYLLSLPVLRLLSLQPGVLAAVADANMLELWVRAVLQGCDWSGLQQAGLCKGRKDGEDRLRALVAGLGDLAVGL